jgi:uncharacterized protein YecT (DUF1311 family)
MAGKYIVSLLNFFKTGSRFMKTPIALTCLFAVFLVSCSVASQSREATPIVITVEVTRIVPITTTPISTETMTPVPTLDAVDQGGTAVAKKIGTPIVAPDECYETAQTQSDLNACAGTRLQELENQMAELVTVIEARYQQRFPEGLEKFQNFHKEWKDFSDRECISSSGLDSDGWAGTMAPMNYAECMVVKYEDRLREYQIELFEWTQ